MTLDLTTLPSVSTQAPPSRVQAMLQSKDRLPAEMRALFEDLFIWNKSEAQIVAERGLTMEEMVAKRSSMIRALKTASA